MPLIETLISRKANEVSEISQVYFRISVRWHRQEVNAIMICQIGLKPSKNAERKHFPNRFPPEHAKR